MANEAMRSERLRQRGMVGMQNTAVMQLVSRVRNPSSHLEATGHGPTQAHRAHSPIWPNIAANYLVAPGTAPFAPGMHVASGPSGRNRHLFCM